MKYFLIVLCSFVSLLAFSQKTLQLTSKSNGKIRSFNIGQTINYRLYPEDDFEKAKIQNITGDSVIVLYLPNEDEGCNLEEVALKDIHSIRKATCFHKTTQAVGAFFILGGAYTMASANSFAGDDGSSGPYIGLGAGMFVLGVIPYLVKPKTYILGETHTAEIK